MFKRIVAVYAHVEIFMCCLNTLVGVMMSFDILKERAYLRS